MSFVSIADILKAHLGTVKTQAVVLKTLVDLCIIHAGESIKRQYFVVRD
jgi:hypothetical protein